MVTTNPTQSFGRGRRETHPWVVLNRTVTVPPVTLDSKYRAGKVLNNKTWGKLTAAFWTVARDKGVNKEFTNGTQLAYYC